MMYVSFIIKKKYRVDETAKKMEISKDSLYRYIRGETIIPPDRIKNQRQAYHRDDGTDGQGHAVGNRKFGERGMR
jgi:hypothetical protein